MGGQLVLLKFVILSLYIYVLSFFKSPSCIISSSESLLIHFLWGGGGGEDGRKVSWESIYLGKEFGGLGVNRMREFNIALLEKWCWWMMADRGGLWFRVLATQFGVGGMKEGGREGPVRWKE